MSLMRRGYFAIMGVLRSHDMITIDSQQHPSILIVAIRPGDHVCGLSTYNASPSGLCTSWGQSK
jgi:hypothetical protein